MRILPFVSILLLAPIVRADLPAGSVVSLDAVETIATAPSRVRLSGAFLSWSGDSYDAGIRGSVELSCPDGRDAECSAQLAVITAARERGDCIAMGWDVAPLAVGAANAWPLLRGVRIVAASDPLCVRARGVRATPPPPPVVAPPQKLRRKPAPDNAYRGYILLNDAINIATAAAYIGVAGYFVASPTLHVMRGHPVRAVISVALRVGLPALGAFLGYAADDFRTPTYAPFIGALIGFPVAMIVDAAALGYATDEPKKITPTVAIAKTGATFGLGLTF